MRRLYPFFFIITWFCIFPVLAAKRIVNLTIRYKAVHFAGKTVKAISINNQIPGPSLHFREGDHVTINVHNHLDKDTAIHWHGLLVPWQMDGVENLSQKGIPPGGTFHYQFTLMQSGTYWYHAHADFQEQQGLYGAMVIDPKQPPAYHYNKDFVVVLSDWVNANPSRVYANLKKEGEYYSPDFPLQPSLAKFIHDYHYATSAGRKKLLHAYHMMQKMRMSIYDISDIAYDAFLLNGKTIKSPWIAHVHVGDVVRLRFIGAMASTIFHVKIPGAKMEIVHIEGNDIRPYYVRSFSIAPGETYDVLVHITKSHPYIIYAESADTLGSAVGALLVKPHQNVNFRRVKPFPEPKPIVMHHNRNHKAMLRQAVISQGTKYQKVIAAVKTNNPHRPIDKIIHMDLSGYMDRYVWFINGVPEYNAEPIKLKPDKRYRIIFTNHSMMHHPMHIHGHWFILRNGHGVYDPLLHTVDVAPGAIVVVDFDTEANGQWFFHCHHLYHMMAGMARVLQYDTLIQLSKHKSKPENYIKKLAYKNEAIVRVDKKPVDFKLVHHPDPHPDMFFFKNKLSLNADPFNNKQQVTYKGMFGTDYNKLQLYSYETNFNHGSITEGNLDVFYWRLLSQFWAIKGGVNYVYRPAKDPYWQPGLGIEGLMPYFIGVDVRSYVHDGSVKFDMQLFRDTQITNNFFIELEARAILATKTVEKDEIGSSLNELEWTIRPYYRVCPSMSVYFQYQYARHYGALKTILQNTNEPVSESLYSIGLSLLF